jgi:hypothetical protein
VCRLTLFHKTQHSSSQAVATKTSGCPGPHTDSVCLTRRTCATPPAALLRPLYRPAVVPASLQPEDGDKTFKVSIVRLEVFWDLMVLQLRLLLRPSGHPTVVRFRDFPLPVTPQPAGYISHQHTQRNRAGKCFHLVHRQRILHVLPLLPLQQPSQHATSRQQTG